MAKSQSESQFEASPDPVTTELLDHLREELGKQTEKTIFTCGGTIPITKPGQAFATDDTQVSSTSEPVTIRWDPATPETPASQAKLVLPLVPDSQGNLENLISDLEPASFGYHGKDVFDETYRKALKMPNHKQLQLAYIAYGNEESLASFYSYCAIIAKVQPSDARSS